MPILSTTVFQRMCTVNPAMRSTLQTCRRRLVSADSSHLELDIVFLGLCCKMLFVVANIGSDGLLGTEGFTVLFTTPIGSTDRSVVGRWMVYVAAAPREIDPRPGWTFGEISGDTSGQ